MQLTFEQGAVVAHPARHLVVRAFAGTGKTSTLVSYALRRPKLAVPRRSRTQCSACPGD